MAIDNQEINTEADLFKILESRQPGDVIAITAQRWRVLLTLLMVTFCGGMVVVIVIRCCCCGETHVRRRLILSCQKWWAPLLRSS